MNPAQYYEAQAAQAQQWSQQMQQYNHWQYHQQQWQYHQQWYQQYAWQQQWHRHYLNSRGRRDSNRRRKERTVCQELHPKFEVCV